MTRELRNCQNCKAPFAIDASDFQFYEKMQVPAPTFCPECRMQRRMVWRNERSLYRRRCDLCKREIIALYSASAPFPVYCQECWFSDGWDPKRYARDYDFSKTFFDQFADLFNAVPRPHFYHRNAKEAQYATYIAESKNVYLSYSIVESEEIYYSKNIDKSVRLCDCLNTTNSRLCYENVFGDHNYNCRFLAFSRDCIDSWFLYDCANCKDCVLSVNLRNKQYVIRNEQYSKEDYFKRLKEFDLSSSKNLENLQREFATLVRDRALHKYANTTKCIDATGDNILNTKNVRSAFDSYDLENAKHVLRFFRSKDSMDVLYTFSGELIYEYANGGRQTYMIRFTLDALENLRHSDYTDFCNSSSYLFGCIGLRKSEYCILNKQYAPDEFRTMRERIIKHMDEMPFYGKEGRVYRFGEFFPIELSPFGYNETLAAEHFPITKEKALARGFPWREPEEKTYVITVSSEQLPDRIPETSDEITKQIIGCAHKGRCHDHCTTAFRVIPEEIRLYREMNIPLPRLCPNCRHYQRLAQRNPIKLWHRQCLCDYAVRPNTAKHTHHPTGRCLNEFETPYAPERPEIVYCESCYNSEVV